MLEHFIEFLLGRNKVSLRNKGVSHHEPGLFKIMCVFKLEISLSHTLKSFNALALLLFKEFA